jgi:hypothetical protein
LKKLFISAKWKSHIAARQRSQAKARVRFADYRHRRNTNRGLAPRRRSRKPSHVRAPAVFSLLRNPSESIEFINRLKILALYNNVFVDLSEVREMTPEAIACLIALLHRFDGTDAGISGNVPTDPALRAMIDNSGFRDHVSSSGLNTTRALLGRVWSRSRSRAAPWKIATTRKSRAN